LPFSCFDAGRSRRGAQGRRWPLPPCSISRNRLCGQRRREVRETLRRHTGPTRRFTKCDRQPLPPPYQRLDADDAPRSPVHVLHSSKHRRPGGRKPLSSLPLAGLERRHKTKWLVRRTVVKQQCFIDEGQCLA